LPTPIIEQDALPEGNKVARFFHWVRGHHRPRAAGVVEASIPRGGCGDSCQASNAAEGLYKAVNVSKGVVIACRVEWAGTSESRRRGLLGRDHIEANEGAYIVPTQWIHMFGMRFPIDVAFLDGEGRVLHVCHALQPNRLSPIVWRAEGALELAAGALRSTGTDVGDIVEIG
jgi:uncharacterized membrane protein (UPF0127 family)